MLRNMDADKIKSFMSRTNERTNGEKEEEAEEKTS